MPNNKARPNSGEGEHFYINVAGNMVNSLNGVNSCDRSIAFQLTQWGLQGRHWADRKDTE